MPDPPPVPEPEPEPTPPPECPDRGPMIDRAHCRTYYCRKYTRVVSGCECRRCAAAGFVYSG